LPAIGCLISGQHGDEGPRRGKSVSVAHALHKQLKRALRVPDTVRATVALRSLNCAPLGVRPGSPHNVMMLSVPA
jgi:hypothetical protein